MSAESALEVELLAVLKRFVAQHAPPAVAADTPESLRLSKGLDATQLARAAGVGLSTLRRIELGQVHRLQSDTLTKIARALGVSFEAYARAAALAKQPSRSKP